MGLFGNHTPIGRNCFFYEGALWVESLIPSKYEVREIEDQGSIKNSLDETSQSTINFLFQRTLKQNPPNKYTAIAIKTAGIFGTAILGPFLGTIWHVYHIGSTLFQTQNEKQKKDNIQGLREHTTALITDGLFAASHAILIYDLFLAKTSYIKLPANELKKLISELPPRQKVFSIISRISIILSFFGGKLTFDVANDVADHVDNNKSLFLKREFGIVGTNGKPLTFDKADDTEKLDMKTRQISGHFTELLAEQTNTVLKACQTLAGEETLTLIECKTPQEFLAAAERSVDPESESLKALQKSIREYNEIRKMVMQFSTPKVALKPFELPAEHCRVHFRPLPHPEKLQKLKEIGEEVLQECAKITKELILIFKIVPANPQQFLDVLQQLNVDASHLSSARNALKKYNILKKELYGDVTDQINFMAQSLDFNPFFQHLPFKSFLSALEDCHKHLNRKPSSNIRLNQIKTRILNIELANEVALAYQVLDVSNNAPLQDCETAYRAVIKHLHPDKNKGDQETSALCNLLTTAKELIRSVKKPDKQVSSDDTTASSSTTTTEIESNGLEALD